MESLTLTPVDPWHAAQTVATFALPASISAPCTTGATNRKKDIPSAFFMGLLRVRIVVSGVTVYGFVERVNNSLAGIIPVVMADSRVSSGRSGSLAAAPDISDRPTLATQIPLLDDPRSAAASARILPEECERALVECGHVLIQWC